MVTISSLVQELFTSTTVKSILLPRGDMLISAHSQDDRLYYIESGTLRAFQIIGEEEVTIRFGYSGEIILALDSFISGITSSFYFQALKKAHVKYIEKSLFDQFILEDTERLKLWNDLLGNFILQQMEREIDLLIDSPMQRYERVLGRSPRLFQEIPAKYIASYLRMTPETLSRLRSKANKP